MAGDYALPCPETRPEDGPGREPDSLTRAPDPTPGDAACHGYRQWPSIDPGSTVQGTVGLKTNRGPEKRWPRCRGLRPFRRPPIRYRSRKKARGANTHRKRVLRILAGPIRVSPAATHQIRCAGAVRQCAFASLGVSPRVQPSNVCVKLWWHI